MKKNALKLTEKDNVATALDDIAVGDTVAVADAEGHETDELSSSSEISRGHKIALRDMTEGEHAVKYGFEIGVITKTVHRGELVHVDNLASARGRGDL